MRLIVFFLYNSLFHCLKIIYERMVFLLDIKLNLKKKKRKRNKIQIFIFYFEFIFLITLFVTSYLNDNFDIHFYE